LFWPQPCPQEIGQRSVTENIGLSLAGDRKPAARASEMVGQEIDRLIDPSAADEERQRRKRRPLKGPKEFRDIRHNRDKSKGRGP
jgi:hypothetical protein